MIARNEPAMCAGDVDYFVSLIKTS